MSDDVSNPPDAEELRDRLIDRGLRELLGGEKPSELSERILTAAGGQPAMATQTLGGEAMNGQKTVGGRSKSRWGWAQFAVAATLLIGASAAFMVSQVKDVETARRSKTQAVENDDSGSLTKSLNAVFSPSSVDDVGSPDPRQRALERAVEIAAANASAKASGNKAGPAGPQLPSAQASEALLPTPSAANDSLRSQAPPVASSPDHFQYYGPQTEAQIPREANDLKMMVTPHVAIQEESELMLGVGVNVNSDAGVMDHSLQGDDRYAAVAGKPTSPLDSRYAKAQIAGNGAIPFWNRSRDEQSNSNDLVSDLDLDVPFRQGSFGFGQGPEAGGDKYTQIVENAFKAVSAANTDNRLSTFSIDVDTASYANVRQFLMQSHTLPPADAVRIEELVNYFDYDYTAPTGDVPFAANMEVAGCPWAPEHRLARIGIKGREMERSQRPPSNLVFLIDVSGSMNEPNKLPLLVEGMKMLTRELGENDRVAIVVYASSEGLALESTRGDKQSEILAALDRLAAGGSTAGGAGIQRAYQEATANFIKGGVNRVILCTDGDFNVGVTSPAELERMAEEKAKDTGVFLTVLGFGRGNLNDAMMEQIADKGNGNYHYVDTQKEARKVLVQELAGTLVTIAKDVKIQVEFNPAKVAGYRLIGYENRVMAAEDFNDDKKDAGEIGAGHTVTALYEIVPAGVKVNSTEVDDLKYGEVASATAGATTDADEAKTTSDADASDELLTLKIRYKAPDGDKSTKLEFPITDNGQDFAKATDDFKFASSVASFGMLLRSSQFKGNATYAGVTEIAEAASKERDPHGYREEFVGMVKRAKELSGE